MGNSASSEEDGNNNYYSAANAGAAAAESTGTASISINSPRDMGTPTTPIGAQSPSGATTPRSFYGQQVPGSSPEMQQDRSKYKGFPGSAFLEKTFCGSIDTTDPAEYEGVNLAQRLIKKADIMCVSSPAASSSPTSGTGGDDAFFPSTDRRDSGSPYWQQQRRQSQQRDSIGGDSEMSGSGGMNSNPSSALLARALVSEVTDNPKTMTPAEMAAREKKLLKAQEAAKSGRSAGSNNRKSATAAGATANGQQPKPVGAPGGVGPPHVLSSLAYAFTGDEAPRLPCIAPANAADGVCNGNSTTGHNKNTTMAPGPLQENRAATAAAGNSNNDQDPYVGGGGAAGVGINGGADDYHSGNRNPYSVTIGLSLSRRHSTVGHPDTVTRQTAFDFNELQDRQYKYVSSTDKYGWRAGGGERGHVGGGGGIGGHIGTVGASQSTEDTGANTAISSLHHHQGLQSPSRAAGHSNLNSPQQDKVAAPDTVHIPIIHIECQSSTEVDHIIHALASGEIFIPHMAILPEALSVNGVSPPDLVVRFGCERNDDLPPDDWPNWCLEFMHNQLYEYFQNSGAVWMKRPFSITLARKVRWKTVKHMNRYFSHAERVIDAWREKGPQYLDPQLSYIEGGATPEEVARPHGIYLFRGSGGSATSIQPTNYFCPNFDPPYTTKMTRSLLLNVLGKSWDKRRREWTCEPTPKLVAPTTLLAAACGCADTSAGGFMAQQVTTATTTANHSPASNSLQQQQHRNSPLLQQHKEQEQRERTAGKQQQHPKSLLGVRPQQVVVPQPQPQPQQEMPLTAPMGHVQQQVKPAPVDPPTPERHHNPLQSPQQETPHLQKQQHVMTLHRIGDQPNGHYHPHEPQEPRDTTAAFTEEKKADEGYSMAQPQQQHGEETLVESTKSSSSSSTSASTTTGSSSQRQQRIQEELRQEPPPEQEEPHNSAQHHQLQDTRSTAAPSTAYSTSVAASNTTVMHTNVTGTAERRKKNGLLVSTKRNGRKTRKENSVAIQPYAKESLFSETADDTAAHVDGEDDIHQGQPQHRSTPSSKFKEKVAMQQLKVAVQREKQLQTELMKAVKTAAADVKKKSSSSSKKSTSANNTSSSYTMHPNIPVKEEGASSPGTNGDGNSKLDPEAAMMAMVIESNMSLEYSTDGSSFLTGADEVGPAGSTSLILGQGYCSSPSNNTNTTTPEGSGSTTSSPKATKSTGFSSSSSSGNSKTKRKKKSRGDKYNTAADHSETKKASIMNENTKEHRKASKQNSTKSSRRNRRHNRADLLKEEEETLASTAENTSSTAQSSLHQESSAAGTATSAGSTVIPTDEELMQVGWAKAFDAASKNYYYFTLDRSQIVWENPLQQHGGSRLDAPAATATISS